MKFEVGNKVVRTSNEYSHSNMPVGETVTVAHYYSDTHFSVEEPIYAGFNFNESGFILLSGAE